MENNERQTALLRGTVLQGAGTYVIEEVLGIGGFGITYLATTEVTWVNGSTMRRRVAVKEHFFSEYSERDADGHTVRTADTGRIRQTVDGSLEDFLAEAKRLQSLADGNANIVKVFDVFRANGTAYYVMEYLEGISLGAAIAGRPLSEADMLAVMKPIIGTVAFLHTRRINHLDIKPDNIVLAEGGTRPVLIDFGQSKHFRTDGSSTSTVNVKGATAGFAPAEQYDGIRTFSPTADVYSLGATMMACLTGTTPPRALAWQNSTKARDIDTLPASRTIKDVITRAVASDPADRFADAGKMLAALEYKPQRDRKEPLATVTDDNKTKVIAPAPVEEEKEDGKAASNQRRGLRWIIIVAILAVGAGVFGIIRYNSHKTGPLNLHLAVEVNGHYYYFSQTEWTGLPDYQKSQHNKKGVVIDKNGQRFILGLHCLNNGQSMTWNEAMRDYSNQMPTKEQGEAIASQYLDVASAIEAFGGSNARSWFWTKTEDDSSYAWSVIMDYGIVYNNNKSNTYRARAVAPVQPSSR